MFKHAIASSAFLAVVSFGASAANGVAQWTQIAPGVYQTVDSDGSVVRQAFGDEGARYDLARFRQLLETTLANGNASDETLRSLRQAVDELSARVQTADARAKSGAGETVDSVGAPPVVNASPGLFGYNNTPTPICGYVAHQLADFSGDASLNPGGGGGSASSSIVYYPYSFTPYTATIMVSATVTPSGGTPITVSGSTTLSTLTATGPTLFTRTANTTGASFSVDASTSSYLNVASCTGGYQSYSKSQTL
jgi:hypothetical protein